MSRVGIGIDRVGMGSSVPPPDPPVNTVAPFIEEIMAGRFATSIGTWTGTDPITYTFQWCFNSSPISGETKSTLDYGPYGSGLYNSIITASNIAAPGGVQAVSNFVFIL